MDASKRSSHSNAFYYGFGGNKRIVLFDTLLEQHDAATQQGRKEILGIVKHELGHWYYNHPLKSMFVGVTSQIFMFWVFSLTINNMSILNSFGFTQKSNFISLIVFSKLYEVVAWIQNFLMLTMSRTFEFQAD